MPSRERAPAKKWVEDRKKPGKKWRVRTHGIMAMGFRLRREKLPKRRGKKKRSARIQAKERESE